MTTRDTWTALAERCEKAKGPDRKIDIAIFKLLNPEYAGDEWQEYGGGLRHIMDSSDMRTLPPPQATPMRYTGSIDAITALIERELPGYYWSAISRATPLGIRTGEGVITNGKLFMSGKHHGFDVFAYTPHLALCAAFCRAKAALSEQPKDSPND